MRFRNLNSFIQKQSRFANNRFAMEQPVSLNQLSPAMQQKAHELYLSSQYSYDDYDVANDAIKDVVQNILIEQDYPEITIKHNGLEWDYDRGLVSVQIERIDFIALLKNPKFAKFKSIARFLEAFMNEDLSTTITTGFHGGYKFKELDYDSETVKYFMFIVRHMIEQYYRSKNKRGFLGLKEIVEAFVPEVRKYLISFLEAIKQSIQDEYEYVESFAKFKEDAVSNDWLFDPMTGDIIF